MLLMSICNQLFTAFPLKLAGIRLDLSPHQCQHQYFFCMFGFDVAMINKGPLTHSEQLNCYKSRDKQARLNLREISATYDCFKAFQS